VEGLHKQFYVVQFPNLLSTFIKWRIRGYPGYYYYWAIPTEGIFNKVGFNLELGVFGKVPGLKGLFPNLPF